MVKIIAPMSGTIVKVHVSAGETVHIDDEVAVIESMKMEIPIPAETEGTVKAVLVQEGSLVQEGDVLIELDE